MDTNIVTLHLHCTHTSSGAIIVSRMDRDLASPCPFTLVVITPGSACCLSATAPLLFVIFKYNKKVQKSQTNNVHHLCSLLLRCRHRMIVMKSDDGFVGRPCAYRRIRYGAGTFHTLRRVGAGWEDGMEVDTHTHTNSATDNETNQHAEEEK